MSKTENTHKMTIRLSPVTEFRLERDYRLDGSRSKNEFIERAITRYQDLLEVEQNETLPTAIQSAIDGRLGMFEDRLARLFYKLAVEMDMGMLGHYDAGFTLRTYTHATRQQQNRAAETIGNFMAQVM